MEKWLKPPISFVAFQVGQQVHIAFQSGHDSPSLSLSIIFPTLLNQT